MYYILFFGVIALWLVVIAFCAWNDTKREQEREEARNKQYESKSTCELCVIRNGHCIHR